MTAYELRISYWSSDVCSSALFQGLGLGADLLADALRRCAAASEIAGARAVIVHSIDDDAVGFYARHGFIASPLGERVLLMARSEERRVGKECVSKFRSRWSPNH